VFPKVVLFVGTGRKGPFLNTGGWQSDGSWNSALAYGFQSNAWGWRQEADARMRRRIKQHVHESCQQLLNTLRRADQHDLLQRMMLQNALSNRCKTQLMLKKLQLPGLPLDMILDYAALPFNRQAPCALFVGDLFIARYARNYFAKELLPHTEAHKRQLEAAGVDKESVCLHCWRSARQCVPEDESHVLFECPSYAESRTDFTNELDHATRSAYAAGDKQTRTTLMLSSTSPNDWKALAKHVARIRQLRRNHKLALEKLAGRMQNCAFKTKADAWRNMGRWVCRHGVFWLRAQGRGCPCMLEGTHDHSWRNARLMCKLDHELQAIVAVPFDYDSFTHLAALRVEYNRQNW